ncbi:MAG: ribosome recycling factor [Sandaracinaceae bacterium]|nr:ribosome recycling factor [Sandaracinaceae bacterium]
MLSETLEDLNESIEKATDALRRELAKIRTGRANPDILDSIRVDYYGTPTPLKQMATIAVPEPRMITVKPFDRSTIGAIEKAIIVGDLGLNPSNDGELIRIPLPPLTEERRKELVKVARKVGEDAKVAIRRARHDAKDMIDAFEKDGDVGADEAERSRKELEEIVKNASARVDQIVAEKEKDILVI